MNPFLQYLNGNMGYTQPAQPQVPPAQPQESAYVQQLRQQLEEAQKMQRQFASQQQPMPQQVAPQQQIMPPVQQDPQTQQVSPEGQAMLALFEEFSNTEDGKALVASIGKFNSFCQSRIAKAQNNS